MLHTSNPITDAEAMKFCIEQQLHATQWAINTMYHTTLKASPAQLVFGWDMIMLTTYLANWAAIQHRKQEVTNADKKQENKHRIPHEYHVGDKILIHKKINKLGKVQWPTQGPFVIVEVQDLPFTGPVVINKGSYKEKINVHHILPFFPQSSQGYECCNTGISIHISNSSYLVNYEKTS